MFFVWTVYASLSATSPNPSVIPLPFTSNGRGMHSFAPTTVTTRVLLEKLIVAHLVNKFRSFMEHNGSLPCSQQPVTPHPFYLKFILMFVLPCELLPPGFVTIIVNEFLICYMSRPPRSPWFDHSAVCITVITPPMLVFLRLCAATLVIHIRFYTFNNST
jgi:hypothetical protein